MDTGVADRGRISVVSRLVQGIIERYDGHESERERSDQSVLFTYVCIATS